MGYPYIYFVQENNYQFDCANGNTNWNSRQNQEANGKSGPKSEKRPRPSRLPQSWYTVYLHNFAYYTEHRNHYKGNGEALLSKWEITAISHKIIYRCNRMHRRFCPRVKCHALMAQPRKSMICCRRLARGVPGGRAGSPRAWETTCAAAAAELQDVM